MGERPILFDSRRRLTGNQPIMDRDAMGFEKDADFEASLVDDQKPGLDQTAPLGLASSSAAMGASPASAPAAGERLSTPGAGEGRGVPDSPPESKWIGKRLSHFRIMRVLGQGTMGVVFQVEDIYLKRIAALKVLRRKIQDQKQVSQVDRFLWEARAAASLDHPNIAQVYEINQHEGWWFIAMEFLEGSSLQHMLNQTGPMQAGRAALMIADAARGLAAAHEAGVIHRDIKPANLMLTRRGRCKVVDFGLVKLDSAENPFQDDESILGTPFYIPPEVVQRRGASTASDVYSLGATLFMLMTGSPPFRGTDIKQVMRQHVEAEPPDLRSVLPGVSASLAVLVREALSKIPERRPSAEAFAAGLQAEVTEALSSPSTPSSGMWSPGAETPGLSRAGLGSSTVQGRSSFGLPGVGDITPPGQVTVRRGKSEPGRNWLRRALVWSVIGVFALATIGVVSITLPRLLVTRVPAGMRNGRAAPQTEIFVNGVGMRLVKLPPGSFALGSPAGEPGRQSDERMVRVTLERPFAIGATEVTQSQWAQVMGATYTPPEGVHPNEALGLRFLGADLPVYVSWYEAARFCLLLSEKEGRYYRLPTEAEWEYACRAGTTGAFGTGSALDPGEANISDDSAPMMQRRPQRVASFGPNAWGLYDMHGNLMEWCADWYGPYELGPLTDPSGPSEGQLRVLRGGSWDTPASLARSANRWANYPVLRTDYVGFRVVMDERPAPPADAPSYVSEMPTLGAGAPGPDQSHAKINTAQGIEVDAALPDYEQSEALRQRLRSAGSDTMDLLMQSWVRAFKRWHKDVTLRHEGRGSGTAPRALAEGFAHFGPMSRALNDNERQEFRAEHGYEPTQLIVATDALAVYVHRENPVARRGMTLAELEAVFAQTRSRGHPVSIDSWGGLGLEGEWKTAPIDLLGRNPASGSYGFFQEKALGRGTYKATMLEVVGSAELIDRIARDRIGVGFSGIGYIRDDIAVVPLARERLDEAVTPTPSSARDGTYPLARPLYLTIDMPLGAGPTPLQREFLRFVLSKQGQQLVIEAGFYPLSAGAAAIELSKLEQ